MNLETVTEQIVTQLPFAGAGLYIAKMYMEKHEAAVQKLLSTFEKEVQACEARYQMVFDELMKLKEKVK